AVVGRDRGINVDVVGGVGAERHAVGHADGAVDDDVAAGLERHVGRRSIDAGVADREVRGGPAGGPQDGVAPSAVGVELGVVGGDLAVAIDGGGLGPLELALALEVPADADRAAAVLAGGLDPGIDDRDLAAQHVDRAAGVVGALVGGVDVAADGHRAAPLALQ